MNDISLILNAYPKSELIKMFKRQIEENRRLVERNNLLEKEFQRIAKDYDDILINKKLLNNS